MQGDSSLMLRMTLTQCFKNLNCYSEHSEESQTPTFRKEKNPPEFFGRIFSIHIPYSLFLIA